MRPRLRRLGLLAAVVLTMVGSASIAYAATIFTYATGANGAGGFYFNPGGWDFRNFNRVYHKAGTHWQLFYDTPGGPLVVYADGTTNPLSSAGSGGVQMRPVCRNIDDSSGVVWTCQSTRP